MNLGSGENVPKSSAPPQQSLKAVETSTMAKKQANGSGPSTSFAPVSSSSRGAPTEQQIAAMVQPKGKNNGRGGKKKGYNSHQTDSKESDFNPQHNSQRGNMRKSGNRRGNPNPKTTGNSNHYRAHQNGGGFQDSPPKGKMKLCLSSSMSDADNKKTHLSSREREPIQSCIAKFLTVHPQPPSNLSKAADNLSSKMDDLDEGSTVANSKGQRAIISSATPTISGTGTTPAKTPVPMPRQPRTSLLAPQREPSSLAETSSQSATPVPIPINVSTSNTETIHSDYATPTPMLPTPATITATPPTATPPTTIVPLSSTSTQDRSGAPTLLQIMEEHKRYKIACHNQSLTAKSRNHTPKPTVRPPRSLANGVRNSNDQHLNKVSEQQKNLPIYHKKIELIKMIKKHPVIIVIGDPGSGKSTQLPQYLLEAGFAKNGRIGVTEPRRIAAKALAERVAYELGEHGVRGTVGYAVRFERQMSARTVIKYMTDGVLVQECADPAHLKEYSVVIIDEAHERSVPTDICFGLLKREAERGGSKLKIIISSATLEQNKFQEYFGGAPIFYISGNLHQPEIIHKPEPLDHGEDYLEKAVTLIQKINLRTDFSKGDILVFLAGQDEIENMTTLLKRSLNEINHPDSQIQIVKCYGALTFSEQTTIFVPAMENHRKVILATNILETSITIEGVVYVIDCGYFKESFYNPVNGISYLAKKRITKFQAIQRYGRAGRTDQGICFRVYSKREFDEMDEAGAPEITRCNLESTILNLAAMGITGWDINTDKEKMPLNGFDLMDLPSKRVVLEALAHLIDLKAVKAVGKGFDITKEGELMASFHLDPSLSRVLIESLKLGCAEEVLKIVSLLSANYQHLFYGQNVSKDVLEKFYHPDGDLLTFLNVYNAWLENGRKVDWCTEHSLQHRVLQEAENIRRQVQSILNRGKKRNARPNLTSCAPGSLNENIRKSFVAGFYRQCAIKRCSGQAYRHLAMATLAEEGEDVIPNEDVYVHPSSVLSKFGPSTPPPHQWIIYNEVLGTSKPYMRAVTVIDPEWIRDYAPDFAKNLEKFNVLARAQKVQVQYEDEGLENEARRLTEEF